MKLASIIGEARRNFLAGGLRSLTLLLILVIGFSATFLEAYSSAQNDRIMEEALIEDGQNVVVLSGPSFSGAECEKLDLISGVIAAGAINSVGSVFLSSTGLRSEVAYKVSTGFWRVVDTHNPYPVGGVLIDQQLAVELGISSPSLRHLVGLNRISTSVLTSQDNSALVRDVTLSPRANYYLGSVFIESTDNNQFDECFVSLRGEPSSDAPVVLASEIVASGNVQGNWLLPRSSVITSPSSQYSNRAGRWSWLVLGVFVSLVLMALARSQRKAIALYRSCGASISETVSILIPEYVLCAFAALSNWATVTVVYRFITERPLDYGALHAALTSGIQFLVFVLALVPFELWLLTKGSPWELLRKE